LRRRSDEYYLMHKNIPVGMFSLDDTGHLRNIRKNGNAAEHFPLGGQMNDMKFHDWWNDRAIPKTRHGAETALQRLGYATTGLAMIDNLALSLSDCYWIKPRGEEIRWEDVNLYANDFVDSFGELTIDPDSQIDIRNMTGFSCATTQGELQKKWCIDDDGKRFFIKGNYGESFQQSLNEVFATDLHEKQKYALYTPYVLTKLSLTNGTESLGCMCCDFCSEHVEAISAWEVLQTGKVKKNESLFYPLKDACIRMGMEEVNGRKPAA